MKSKDVPFSQYFEQWLYGENGYYSKYKKIGKHGDFYTSVSSSKFFGGAIAKRIIDIIEEKFLDQNSAIIEIGAHHGYLLADIIQFIFTLKPKLLDTLSFIIIERFDHLQKQQKEYFKMCYGDTIQLQHYKDISEVNISSACIVANEIFDSFPCDLVYTDNTGTLQHGKVNNNKITFENIQDENLYLKNYCKRYDVSKGEIARGYEKFASLMSKNIKKFEFITFDYGDIYPRNDFSCRIYSQHSVYPLFDDSINLETYYNKSDITYDVNFQHLINCFEDIGVKNINYQTQLKALVSFGIIELLEILHDNVDEKTYTTEANKVKTLLNPTGMGDRFKMANFRQNKKDKNENNN